jgi:hypothetical protein
MGLTEQYCALARLAVLEDAVIQQWETVLTARPDLAQVDVVRQASAPTGHAAAGRVFNVLFSTKKSVEIEIQPY